MMAFLSPLVALITQPDFPFCFPGLVLPQR